MRRSAHRPPRPFLAGCAVCAWCLAACVQWRPVAPPAPGLPRWVRVTTRDSARYLLEGAAFRGDTLVGRASGGRAAAPVVVVRVPAADIAHLEARVPSVTGSVKVAAAVVAGVAALAWAVGHAATP